ncbi:Protein of unknown function, putative adhesine [Flavobacterium indicum GPTSA100-9 = DSM 17447]|uniref:HYR-like domain-containing protein n=1 Tax=Flavobacterium indicum (strain DSM 17447 / CIP 109464 / GPTSA100-9) TaxID=1094466 RepID=H8XPK3_FLAIG|nr:T9SS C-terminal target domain-containing protein [Flavobacterium indicum]CCG53277.1 Protein of unknown function, putative adhesine [Flavobacterium indicum GPTSA100-9 = DSM 17447]
MSTATFTIQDTTAPVIAIQATNQTVECDGNGNSTALNAWLASNGGASATDACSNVTWTNNFTSLSDTCGATGSATVTFTATDNCGNSTSSTATFTIQDTTAPVIAIQAANQTVECDGNGNTTALNAWLASNGGASATDACSNVTWTNNFSSVSDTCGATGSATVTFTATDTCGNSSSSTATFTIQDTTAPVIAIQAANQTVECDGNGNTAALNAWLASNGGASATDACSNVTWTNNFTSLSDTCGATGSATVTFTATDNCGNSSSSTATFTIQDTTAPVIAIQAANQTVECDGNGNSTALNAWLASNGGASASDTCSNVTWTNNFSSLSDTCGATGSATVTFTATDNCGNSTSSTATFTIQDTTAPVIAIQATNQTVECDGNGNTAALNAWLASNGGASATDACSNVTWTNNFSSVSDTCGATGSATVTFTATDTCGNSTSSTATFTIQDTTAPVIAIQAANQTVECDGNGNSTTLNAWLASNGGASASDACSSVTWTNNFTSLSDTCGATGSATVTFTATDSCGNSTSSTATFTIQDTTAPVIAIQAANQTVECDGNGNTTALNAWLASNGGASASDACSNVTWTNNFTSLSDTCGATGSATVTFTATDTCGNSSTSIATFTIQDTTAPVIAIQAANQTVECDGNGNTTALNAWLAANGGASASDVCSNVTWTNNFSSLSDTCGATGSATVTFTATDSCGNSTSSTATFTIQDTTAPVIAIQAANQTVECDGNGNSTALNAWLASNGGASATDACSSVTWTNNFSSVSDTCGATGSATVTFTATDNCGNSSTSTATFTIQDTTAPVITSTLPENISVSCDAIPQPVTMTSSDACDNEISITVNDVINTEESNCAGNYIIYRTWTFADDCQNVTTYTQTITVFDTSPPTLVGEIQTDINANCDAIPTVPNLQFIDNCYGIGTITFNETTSIISIYQYNIIREWIVSDNCGNEATFTQTIHVTVEQPFDAIPYTICQDETPIDLFTLLNDNVPITGTWVEDNTSGALNGSIFDPSGLVFGYYTIKYIVNVDDDSCPMIFEVYIHVDDCGVLANCEINVYNAVSPNGDGLNDVFIIDGITCYPNNTVEIYNRWGILVYDTSGYNNSSIAFKGYSENKLTVGDARLPGDTYFYILKYKDAQNNSFEKTGYLYLKY